MPEGHTIHGLARSMSELVGQHVEASSPQGRLSTEAIDGHQVRGMHAYGKHLLVDTSADLSVHVHLGMRGKWLRFAPVSGPALKQVRLRLRTPDVAWDLIAPSACELLDGDRRSALVDRLGPDPLRPDADEAEAKRRIVLFRGSIGAALMDQSVLAGVGNVFRAEALHACRIQPRRPASALAPEELDQLWHALQAMMTQAVLDGRIITVDADDRLAVPEGESRRVYKRHTCYDCGTPVVAAPLDGRTSYHCPQCQAR